MSTTGWGTYKVSLILFRLDLLYFRGKKEEKSCRIFLGLLTLVDSAIFAI